MEKRQSCKMKYEAKTHKKADHQHQAAHDLDLEIVPYMRKAQLALPPLQIGLSLRINYSAHLAATLDPEIVQCIRADQLVRASPGVALLFK